MRKIIMKKELKKLGAINFKKVWINTFAFCALIVFFISINFSTKTIEVSADSVPIFTDNDGFIYTDDDAYQYTASESFLGEAGICKWNISKNRKDNLFAYVFAKKKSNTPGDVDNSDLILVFTGDCKTARCYNSALGKYENSKFYQLSYYSTDGNYRSAVDNFDSFANPTTEWTLCIDKNNIKSAVVTENVECDYWNFWFAGLENLSNVRIDLNGGVKKKPEQLMSTFQGCGLTDYSFLQNIDTSNTTLFSYMFALTKAEHIPCEYINVSSAQFVADMFAYSNIKTFDLSTATWNISNVHDDFASLTYHSIFWKCDNLEMVDLTGLVNSGTNIKSLRNLFYGLQNLKSVKFGDDFDTSNINDFNGMFYNCINLTNITFGSKFKISDGADISWMFSYTNLDEYDFSIFGNDIKPGKIGGILTNIYNSNCVIDMRCLNLEGLNQDQIKEPLGGFIKVKRIYMPKAIPTGFDILLPDNLSAYLAYDSNGDLLSSLENNGVVTKFYPSDVVYYVDIYNNKEFYLSLINNANSDDEMFYAIGASEPNSTFSIFRNIDSKLCEKYSDKSLKDRYFISNYIYNKLLEKKNQATPSGYTTFDEFFNDLKTAIDTPSIGETFTYQTPVYGEKLNFTIGGTTSFNTEKIVLKYTKPDQKEQICNIGNNVSDFTVDTAMHISVYKILKNTSFDDSYIIADVDIRPGMSSELIFNTINNASTDTAIVSLLSDDFFNTLEDSTNVKFETRLEDFDDSTKDFVKNLIANLLWTTKGGSSCTNPYTTLTDIANDTKLALSFEPVLKINNQTEKAYVINGQTTKFNIGNGNEKILNLFDIEYHSCNDTGYPCEFAYVYDKKNFIKLDWEDEYYNVYATSIQSGKFDSTYGWDINIPKNIRIDFSGDTPNPKDNTDQIVIYYYWSEDDTSFYSNDYQRRNGIYDHESFTRGTNRITKASQINIPIVVEPFYTDYKTRDEDVNYYFNFGLGDNSYNHDSNKSDGRLYIKFPKSVRMREEELISGWSGLKTINASQADEKIYLSKLTFKNSDYASSHQPSVNTNATELIITEVTLTDSDFTFPETTSFVYDGNAHYIDGTINPKYENLVEYTTTYLKDSQSGEVIDKENIKDAGTYYVKITVTSDVTGTSKKEWIYPFTITPKSNASLTIDPVTLDPIEYTGSGIDPSSLINLKDEDTSLVQGKDYTVSFEDSEGNTLGENPSAIGSYTLVITGTGNYEGTKTIPFEIVKKNAEVDSDSFDSVLSSKLTKVYDGLNTFRIETTMRINETDVPVILNGTFDNKNVGERNVTISVELKNNADKKLYTLTNASFTKSGEITKKEIEWTASAESKIYDGNKTIQKNAITPRITNLEPCDVGRVSLELSAEYYDEKVGEDKTVKFTITNLKGLEAGNYKFLSNTKDIDCGQITPKMLSYSITVGDKTYDGSKDNKDNTTAEITGGKIGSDDVFIEVVKSTFANANFGKHDVEVILKLSGNDKDNYIIEEQATKSASINQGFLTLSFETKSKVYDGNKDGSSCITKVIAKNSKGQVVDVPIKINSALFDDKNVGDEKTITVNAEIKNAEDGANYKIDSSSLLITNGKITEKEIDWTVNVDSKEYDGTNNVAPGKIHYTITNLESCDQGKVTLDLNASYATKNVDSGKTIFVTLTSLMGLKASNYKISADSKNKTITNGEITAKKISYALAVGDKIFDGSDDNKANTSVAITDGKAPLDDVDIEVVSATFDNTGFGTHNVSVRLRLVGDDSDNYEIDQPDVQSAKITQNLLNIEFNVSSKVYDGTPDAKSLVSIKKITDKDGIKNNSLLFIKDAKFENKNAGENKVINVTVDFTNPADATGYDINSASLKLLNGTITKLDAEYTLGLKPKVYDGSTNITPNDITVTLTNKIAGDDAYISAIGAYYDPDVADNIRVDFNLSMSGNNANNYNLVNSTPSENIGKITERQLIVIVTPNNKEFDGTTSGTAAVRITSGKVNGDDVKVEINSAYFADSNKGLNKPFNVSLKLSGSKKDNYFVNDPQGLTANISNRIIKLEFNIPLAKTYDGNKDASKLVTIKKVTDSHDILITDVPVRIKSATFADKNQGTGKEIILTCEFENEADKNNYEFDKSSYTLTNGKINPKELSYSIIVDDKVYDGTTVASASVDKNTITGICGSDKPTIIVGDGEFSSKNAGDNILATFPVQIDDSNYSINSFANGYAKIKKRDLHIDATTDDGEYDIGDPINVHFNLRSDDMIPGDALGLITNDGSGTVIQGERTVKKVTIDSWPSLTGQDKVKDNYNVIYSDCYVNLTRIDVTNENLQISCTPSDYYDGNPKNVQVVVKFPELGKILVEREDFLIEYLDDRIDVGKHDIRINFIGEYKGTKEVSYEIKQKPSSGGGTSGGGGGTSGGGGGSSGGGGGGVAPSGPTYTILPQEENVPMHKAFMNGYEDKTFKPQDAITREEVATIVARLHDEYSEDYNFTSNNSFPDVDTRWSKNYIGFCKMKGLIHGYEDGTFHPTSYMTRAELATLVSNFLRFQNVSFDNVDLSKPAFVDVEGEWYEDSVNKLAYLGILNGYEDGTFKGGNYVTRIEVAIVMNKVNHRTITKDIPEEYIKKISEKFKDITPDKWYFNDVAESVIDHPADLY